MYHAVQQQQVEQAKVALGTSPMKIGI